VSAMVFRPTAYLRPRSIEETVALLELYGESAVLIAGGITVNELAKRGLLSDVEKVVDIEGLGLSWIRMDGSDIRIGAAATYTEILHHEAFKTPALMSIHEAVSKIHPDQVRNIGTIGGAICSGFPFLDLVTGLLPHDVDLRIVGPRGERRIALEAFALAGIDDRLRRGEVLKEVTVSRGGAGKGSAFVKYGQTALDLAVLNCSVSLHVDEKGVVTAARVFAAGKGVDITSPPRCADAIVGRSLGETVLETACAEMAVALPAVSDTRGSAAFRRYTIKRLLREALGTAYRRSGAPWASRSRSS
jgi:carbon-monoxide dehydrogenase medium subunit